MTDKITVKYFLDKRLGVVTLRSFNGGNRMDSYEKAKDLEIKEIIPDSNDMACTYIPDVTYITRNGLDLHLQIIKPDRYVSEGEKYPLIVFVQGSGWYKQNCYMNVPQLSRFAQRGYVTAILEYRDSGVSPFPAQVEDAKTGIRFLRKNADEYGIDPDLVYIWGDSSGGHTALLAGLTCDDKIFDTEDYGEYSCKVNGIIDYYGVTDITDEKGFPDTPNSQKADSPEGLLIGGKDVLANPELSNPTIVMNHISEEKSIVPILIFHGTKDNIVSFRHSLRLYEKLMSCGKEVDFYAVKDAGHGGAPFWRKDVLDIVDDFIQANM